MNLIVFDCDDTFWELPYEEDDKYMDLSESINNYDFKYKPNIVYIYNEKRKDKNNKFVILTNRSEKVKSNILEKLKEDKNIEFDFHLFRRNDRDKSNRLEDLLDTIDVKEVEFYDDKEKHIISVNKLKSYSKYSMITFKTYKV